MTIESVVELFKQSTTLPSRCEIEKTFKKIHKNTSKDDLFLRGRKWGCEADVNEAEFRIVMNTHSPPKKIRFMKELKKRWKDRFS